MARKTFGNQEWGDEGTLLPNNKPGDEYSDQGAESWKSNDGTAAPRPEQLPAWDKKTSNPGHPKKIERR